MNKLFCLLSLCCLVACGGGGGSHHHEDENDPQESCSWLGMIPKIRNGASCDETKSPIVSLLIVEDDNDIELCTGTLIDPTSVLTAAHCLDDNIKSVYVRYGNPDENKSSKASQLFLHPKFDGEHPKGDIAIVKLSSSILDLPTVPLLFSRVAKEEETGTIFGYGSTGTDSSFDFSTRVLKGGFAHVTEADNEVVYMKYLYDSNTCEGDSGGPLVLMQNGEATVAAVTSSGTVEGCGYGDRSYFAALQDPEVQSFITSHSSPVIR